MSWTIEQLEAKLVRALKERDEWKEKALANRITLKDQYNMALIQGFGQFLWRECTPGEATIHVSNWSEELLKARENGQSAQNQTSQHGDDPDAGASEHLADDSGNLPS